MKRNTLFTILSILLSVSLSFAQGELKFKTDNHDFGNVEEGNLATYKFEFTNTGKEPVVISNVQASCGCTTPSWTKEPVMPGKTGEITASYNSAGRPGVFNKTITVTSNAATPSVVLTIKGVVNQKAEKAPTAEELKKSPGAVLNKAQHNFGKLEKGQTVSHKFVLMNNGQSDLKVAKVQSACSCVSYTLSKPAVKGGETAELVLKYTPRIASTAEEVVTIFTNDLKNPTQKVTLQANVVESLATQSMLKEQKQAVPFK